jgi:acyl-CoA synthetase (NDP forming)
MQDAARRLERPLNPRSVVVVGDKSSTNYQWLRNLEHFGGRLASVQIDEREIAGIEALGVTNYRSLKDVPDEIDLVISAVPRQVALRVLADAIDRGVGGIAYFTSGFAETGEPAAIAMQERMTEMARAADLPLIGPNCMGVYNPRLGVRFNREQVYGQAGNVGFISQSGTHAMSFSLQSAANGIRVSTAISIGNSIILDASDYLEYFAHDPATQVIGIYLEGVKDGRRFVRVLRETAAKKPVLIWKGGRTDAGARATMSHTASLATPSAVWEAVRRQTGAIEAGNLDELLDALKLLLSSKPATGRRVALLAMTGGQSVVITDAFAAAGLEIPSLEASSYAELAAFFNIIGGSYRNPFDMAGTINQAGQGGDENNLERLLRIVDADPNVDAVAMEMSVMFGARRWERDAEGFNQFLDTLTSFRDRSAKPFLLIMHPAHLEAEAAQIRLRLQERDLPVIPSFERAALALRRVTDYHRLRGGLD